MSEAEHGRAMLSLVDTALETLPGDPGPGVRAFRCGPTTVRIRSAGAHPSPYLPFSHLPAASHDDHTGSAPALLIDVCDGPFPGARGRRPPGGFHRARDERTFVSVTDGPAVVAGVRPADSRALSWIADPARAPLAMRFRPFAEIFSAWFPSVGMVVLHAAAVGGADGVVLLVGDGGSGKSTTSLLCSRAGLGFLADDFCLLEHAEPPRVHSIYRSAKLRGDSVRRVPGLIGSATDARCDDHYFLIEEAATVVSGPIRAVIAVRPADEPSGAPRLTPVPRDAVLPLLLPTALKLPSGGELAYRTWLRSAHAIARCVPAFSLDLTWDAEGVVDLVQERLR